MKPALLVLDGERLGRATVSASLPTLASQPFRPGEVPQLLLVELDHVVAEWVEAGAAAAAIPRELWLRVAVETSRHLRRAADLLGVQPSEVVSCVEEIRQAPSLAVVEALRYDAYAKQIRQGVRPHKRRAQALRLSIPIPESMLAAWSIDAAAGGLTPSEFVCVRALEAPAVAASWEAASAERAQSLGEWIYEAVIRAITRR